MLICFMFFSVIIIKVTPCNICLADKFKKNFFVSTCQKTISGSFQKSGSYVQKIYVAQPFLALFEKKIENKRCSFSSKEQGFRNLTKLLDGVNCQQQFYLQQTRSSSYLQQRKISDVIKTAEAKTRVFFSLLCQMGPVLFICKVQYMNISPNFYQNGLAFGK